MRVAGLKIGPWNDAVVAPVKGRTCKPRRSGRTMVIDKGLGLRQTHDLLEMCSPYIDFIKLAFGTSVLYDEELLRRKVRAIRSYDVDVYPGGTLLELAMAEGRAEKLIERAQALGFTCIEVSEGTLSVSSSQRQRLIHAAVDAGLRVITEVGKKDRSVQLRVDEVVRYVEEDREAGAEIVIIEGRDSGKGVGVYDSDGNPRTDLIADILRRVQHVDALMWEAPITGQQQHWLLHLGPNVNLGNVQPADVMSLEATRQGLRGDTLRECLEDLEPGEFFGRLLQET